jgi:hypothetical protein
MCRYNTNIPFFGDEKRKNCLEITENELIHLLEWAGSKLLQIPIKNPKPAEGGVYWPQIIPEETDKKSWDKNSPRPLKLGMPSLSEQKLMDEILNLVLTVNDVIKRRIIHARLLVNPVTNHNCYSWKQIALILNVSPKTCYNFFKRGLSEIITKVDNAKLQQMYKTYKGL